MKNKVSQSESSNRKKRLSSQEMQTVLMNLEETFLRDVKAGLYTPGNPLPSLHQMEERYGVSYHLARQFYSHLETRGIVLSVRGKGIFLARIPEDESFMPNVLLYSRGILVVGTIDMDQSSSALNCATRWLTELEDECLELKIPFRFLNLCGMGPDESALKFRDLLERVRPAGVIFLDSVSLPLNRMERKRCSAPAISINVTQLDEPGVIVDDAGSGYLATDYLLKEGYRRIAYLAYPDSFSWQKDRLEGYAAALWEAGITPDPELVLRVRHSLTRDPAVFREAVFHAADILFPKCDAILCGSDILGILFLEYAQKRGLAPAERPALVGFDNQYEWRGRELSSVAPAWERQAREALRLLMEWIVSPRSKRISAKIAGRLYIRNSSFKPEERE